MGNYCKLFTQPKSPRDDIVSDIASIAGGIRHRYRISTSSMELYVMDNDDYDAVLALSIESGFLHYQFFLDIEASENAARGDYIASVGKLLESLWRNDFLAVAACDFESELPRSGGYIFYK